MLLSGMGDRKKMATEIVIAMGPKHQFRDRKEKGYNEENVSNEEPEEFGEYHAMAEELMDGVAAKDSNRIASVLRAFAAKFEPSHGESEKEWNEAEEEEGEGKY